MAPRTAYTRNIPCNARLGGIGLVRATISGALANKHPEVDPECETPEAAF
jgi:hypothetical protein